jgi:hypothetical protein
MNNQGDQWRPFEPSREAVAHGELELAALSCRRCSDCIGQEHHWMENFRLVDETDPYFICKHCPAACGESDDEQGFAEPSGVLVAQPPICADCDEYTKVCECDLGDDCIADDSTECDCSRCVGAEDRFWREQGEGGGS